MSLLTVNNIRVRYNERLVLDELSFTINERDRIGMVGRNGSGKSTLLRILTHRQEPDSGRSPAAAISRSVIFRRNSLWIRI